MHSSPGLVLAGYVLVQLAAIAVATSLHFRDKRRRRRHSAAVRRANAPTRYIGVDTGERLALASQAARDWLLEREPR